jgi:exo-1,4-beta-D-glucosaminidase
MDAYSRVAQTMTYDGERAMFEAYTRNKYTSTGVIQWMLNNAWPSVIWHLYDYYLQTGGGYFGTKKACEPLHVQYSYDDHSIYAVSSLPVATPSLQVQADVYDLDLKSLFHQTKTVNLPADRSQRVLDIPVNIFQPEQSTRFVRLEMKNALGKIVSQNFYWIPSKLTVFDWPKTEYTYTPAITYANMQALRTLPKSQIRASLTTTNHILHVLLENPSHSLAFQVEVQGFTEDGKPIIPLLWSDDFVELMPGEHRDLTAELPKATNASQASVIVSGWNTNTVTLGAKPVDHASAAAE